MTTDLPVSLRRLVVERAGFRCEYCLMPQAVALHKHEPDHIIPRQHGGESGEDNLALACMRCNRYKGPNIGSYDPRTKDLVPLFNPRKQKWPDHFRWEGAIIQPLSPEARVTVRLLRLNDGGRIAERESLMASGVYLPDDRSVRGWVAGLAFTAGGTGQEPVKGLLRESCPPSAGLVE